MRILFLRFSSIGDILLTTPIVRSVAKQLPGAELHYFTKPAFAPLVAHNPHLMQVHRLEEPLAQQLKTLRALDFDFIVDLHKNLRSYRIRWALGAVPGSTFRKLNFRKWLLTQLKIDQMPNLHIVERYAEAIAPLGVALDEEGLELHLPPECHQRATDVLSAEGLGRGSNEFIVLALGARHFTKQYPEELSIRLLKALGKPVVLLGGPDDHPKGATIARELPGHLTCSNLAGELSLLESAAVLAQAQYVLTPDTGLMHIAAAFNKRVYSIWGNTVPALGMYPYRTDFVAFEASGLPCRPCHKLGHPACPKGHFKCMRLQEPEAMAAAITYREKQLATQ